MKSKNIMQLLGRVLVIRTYWPSCAISNYRGSLFRCRFGNGLSRDGLAGTPIHVREWWWSGICSFQD